MAVCTGALDDAEAPVEQRLVEGAVLLRKVVGLLLRLVRREGALLAPFAGRDVDSPALNEVAGAAHPAGVAVARAARVAGVDNRQSVVQGKSCYVRGASWESLLRIQVSRIVQ